MHRLPGHQGDKSQDHPEATVPSQNCIRCDLYLKAERGFCGWIWSANGLLLGVKAVTPASCIVLAA